MFGRIVTVAALATTIVGASLYASAQSGNQVRFPKNYRNWAVAKTTLVGPNSPGFAVNGGLHLFYANREARRSYDTRPFDEGSILVDERVHSAENPNGLWIEGATLTVAVMIKDSQRYAQTGGWGFNFFRGDDRTVGIPPEAQETCFTQCHARIPERDFVFSNFRRP